MKFSTYCLALSTSLFWFSTYAQPDMDTSNVLTRACYAIYMLFGWEDGQSVPVEKLQEIINTMSLPKNYELSPEEGVDMIANLDKAEVPHVIFHCLTDEEPLEPNTIAKFYFSYLLPDRSPMQTPEFVVTKQPGPEMTTSKTERQTP